MTILHDIALRDFEFWSGAKATRDCLSDSEMDILDELLEEMFPEGIDPTTLNDIFWFDTDYIAELLGYEDFNNDIWNARH